MRLLLDTHSLLWWWDGDTRLSLVARSAILDTANEIIVSAATSWEIATKYRLGRPGFPASAHLDQLELLRADGFRTLPISIEHARRAGSYDLTHRDPFDRMIAAQSELEGAPLVTCDKELRAFPISIFW